jgi:proline dehydrogenase
LFFICAKFGYLANIQKKSWPGGDQNHCLCCAKVLIFHQIRIMSPVLGESTVHLPFEDTAEAFAHKSNWALLKSNLLFTVMNQPFLVDIGARFAEWAFRHKLPVRWMVRHTIYPQFCGGESLDEVSKVIHELGKHHIKTILDYGVEAKASEADFEKTAEHLLQTLEYARKNRHIHILSMKLSGLFRFELLEKVGRNEKLSPAEQAAWEQGLARVDRICGAARDSGISVHIDAEQSWIQGAIDRIAWIMSERHNQTKPTVINAVQMYRKDRMAFLEASLEHAIEHSYLCAVKIVRGAYMEKERARAKAKGYPDPIHESLEGTHSAYNQALEFCIRHIKDLYVCNATHNEESCRLQAQIMERYGMPPNHPHTATAQLYGMSDNISYIMAKAGYNVEKYLPYGPVAEVIPYLIRRTRENTSSGGQMSRELKRLRAELKRRGIFGA